MNVQHDGLPISDFAIGFRFTVDLDSGFTPEEGWNLLFGALPADKMAGVTLYEARQCGESAKNNFALDGVSAKEDICLCVINNISLKRLRKLYPLIANNAAIQSRLHGYRPVYLSNRLENLKTDFAFLGTVSPDGTVKDGAISRGDMRFHGPAFKKQRLSVPTLLVTCGETVNGLTCRQCAATVMRMAGESFPGCAVKSFRAPDGKTGTVDAIVASLGGRYGETELKAEDGITARMAYGILPDRTVAFETDSKVWAERCICRLAGEGYTSFCVHLTGDAAGQSLVLPEQAGEGPAVKRIDGDPGDKTLLRRANFPGIAAKASAVIIACGNGDGAQNPLTQAMLALCKERNVPAFTVECAVSGGAEETTKAISEGASQLFATLKPGRRFRKKRS